MFKRLGNLIKGFFGLFVSGLEKQNPEALLEVERENLRKQIAQYNQGLAAHAGLCERLITQVRKLETEERELRARTTAMLRANNREAAVKNAQSKIEALRFSLDDLKIKKATAELTQMASGMVTQIGGAGDTLERLQRVVEEEREL